MSSNRPDCGGFLIAAATNYNDPENKVTDSLYFYDSTLLHAGDIELSQLTVAQALLLAHLTNHGFNYSSGYQISPIIESLKQHSPATYSIITRIYPNYALFLLD